MGRNCLNKTLSLLVTVTIFFISSGCNGKAEEFFSGNYLGDAVIGDGGGDRNDGTNGGQIYSVTTIVEATNGIPEWTDAQMPFTGTRQNLGTITTNHYWPFKFTFTYPSNNYSIGEAHLIFATQRDNSDTEGIFIDGILTGRPPGGNIRVNSPEIIYENYSCVGACSNNYVPTGTPNMYFMDWTLKHYKIGTINTIDLDITDLITNTPLTVKSILDDGIVRVISGDDAYVATDNVANSTSRPLLIKSGYTISNSPLTCSTSPLYRFTNRYIHNDGNSIGTPAFTGSVLNPNISWTNAYTTFRSTEFFFDPKLPQLTSYTNLNLTTANLVIQIKRANTGPTALVINGIGFDQTGFDRTTGTSSIESWSVNSAALNYYNTAINAVAATNTSTVVTLNLVTLLGAEKVKELLLQGKLNVSVAGPIAQVYGQAATSSRTYGVSVNGPELVLTGNFTAEICEIPNDPGSPLNGATGDPTACHLDTASPIASSIRAVSVTATSATIQWLTNESATSQVGYGISGPISNTTEDTVPKTFHSVTLTGLQPYKYYQYNVKSLDGCGNLGTSASKTFRTLR